MSGFTRRKLLVGATVLTGTAAAVVMRSSFAQTTQPRVIEVTAKCFEYVPNIISVKQGEKVVLAITSLDFIHGMNIPSLGMRYDLVPGRVTRVEIEVANVGNIGFVCDNFCGDHHEDMHGRIVVSA